MNRMFKLNFLGKRTYLHSSTLFSFLQKLTGAESNISFKCVHPIYTDCIEILDETENADAVFQYEADGNVKILGIKSASLSQHPEILPGNEQVFLDKAQFSEKTIAAEICRDTFFPCCVALIKELHSRFLQKDVPGRWIFSRADFSSLPCDGKLIVELCGAMPQITCCAVRQNDIFLGKVYFSWVEKI